VEGISAKQDGAAAGGVRQQSSRRKKKTKTILCRMSVKKNEKKTRQSCCRVAWGSAGNEEMKRSLGLAPLAGMGTRNGRFCPSGARGQAPDPPERKSRREADFIGTKKPDWGQHSRAGSRVFFYQGGPRSFWSQECDFYLITLQTARRSGFRVWGHSSVHSKSSARRWGGCLAECRNFPGDELP